MRVHRLQNPFEHWIAGLTYEIAVFALFLGALAGAVILVAWAV